MNDDSVLGSVTPRVILGGFVVSILIALVVAATTSPATLGSHNPEWDGTSAFRNSIDTDPDRTPVVTTAVAYDRFDAPDTLVVVLAPREPYSAAEVERIQAFLARGGTLLVAEDRRAETNRLLVAVGASTRIDTRQLRDSQRYHRDPALPVVTNTTNTSVVTGVDGFTLNRAGALRPGGATTLARTSEFAYLDENRNEQLDPDERLRSYPVLTAESVNGGEVIVLSDPSVFINRMLERDGNAVFSNRLTTSYDRVVMDFSHSPGAPPATILWLWLRRTTWVQALLGGLAVTAVLLVTNGRFRARIGAATTALRGRHSSSIASVTLDSAEVRRFLEREHPDWDSDRIDRVTKRLNDPTETQSSHTDE